MLELGSVPLPVTARIDRFSTEDGKGPYPDMEWSRSGEHRLPACWFWLLAETNFADCLSCVRARIVSGLRCMKFLASKRFPLAS